MARSRKRKIDLDQQPRRFPAFLTAPVRDELAAIAADQRLAAKWQPGRQGTGYEKLDLRAALADGSLDAHRSLLETSLSQARVSFGKKVRDWDAYLLRYTDGAHVPDHIDPTDDAPHLRLNVLVVAADSGTGQLRLFGDVFEMSEGDAVLFRPDVIEHRVTPVVGERIMFSVGCIFEPDE